MFRLRASLTGVFTVAAIASAPSASAAAPTDAGLSPNCASIEQQLGDAQRALRSCTAELQTTAIERNSCSDQLVTKSEGLDAEQGRASKCEASRASLCSEAAAFVEQVVEGKVTNIEECVPESDQSKLRQLLAGWRGEAEALRQLVAYTAGDADAPPSVRGTSVGERLLARLLGPNRREPLLYRRLLTDALRLTAPRAWERIRSSGPWNVDAWFDSTGPLDPMLVEEAQRTLSGLSAGAPGPSLSTALRLAQAYESVVHCDEETRTGPCRRARQIQQLLESTGPLLLRQRVEDIWATDCRNISAVAVLAWVQDFPAASAASNDFSEVAAAAQHKLYTCFLTPTDGESESLFRPWLDHRLPSPRELNSRSLGRVDAIRAGLRDDSSLDVCGQAVRTMRHFDPSAGCEALPPQLRASMERWAALARNVDEADVPLNVCRRYVELLWQGYAAHIPSSFDRPPTTNSTVRIERASEETPFGRLREACEHRRGKPQSFAQNVRALSRLSRDFGDSPAGEPWRADPATGEPVEAHRFEVASTFRGWVKHVFSNSSACRDLGLTDARCQECRSVSRASFYDCSLEEQLDGRWAHHEHSVEGSLAGLLSGLGLVVWAERMRRARRGFLGWSRETRARFAALGFDIASDPLRIVLPSRNDVLVVALPLDAHWERWGSRACVVRLRDVAKVEEHDVRRAVAVCQRVGARVVFLLHDDEASLHFGAVRAILDWAARGGTRAIHVLPLSWSRLAWARAGADLLDLVEETSMRGNPFEVRDRITSSSQFWNRERLVSGLLAEAHAGRWTVVTGLRRFGKSSLALEVARRLPGPSAYADLAGFYQEISLGTDAASAVDSVLRSLSARLLDSARALYPTAELPEAPTGVVDASALTRWMRSLSSACAAFTEGRPPPMLLVFDELEQALSIGPERLGHSLDVLAVLLGRLRNALGDSPAPEGNAPVGILFCCALHPLLWAPLPTLGQQSIMGAFPSLCVPCLSDEAASAMMIGLGARQGIRFDDDALAFVVRESQGVPLLLRRLGSSILELFDADHARQGSLGAVHVGREAAREAVEREEREGSPLRVWVESEIAEPNGPAGAMLRALAASEQMSAAALRGRAQERIARQFAVNGITRWLGEHEVARRAQEAASVMLRLLRETGLLVAIGDPTDPEAYKLPDGSIRRVLNASPTARRER